MEVEDIINYVQKTPENVNPNILRGQLNTLVEDTIKDVIEPITITQNGTYTAEQGKAYTPVTVAVPIMPNPFEYVELLGFSASEWTVDENDEREFYISAPNAVAVTGFYSCKAKKIPSTTTFIIDIPNQTRLNNFTFGGFGSAGKTNFVFPSGLRYNGATYFLYDIRTVEKIIGEIDMTGVTAIGEECLTNPTSLKKIFFVPNSARVMFSFNAGSGASLLEDESIISIGNALNESTAGQTLVLHATPKARCSSIVGTVAMDSTNTFHVFTADPTGSVTLADFITNVKGWTLA